MNRYQTRLKILKSFNREQFLVYGCDRDDQDGSIVYKHFSKNDYHAANNSAIKAMLGELLENNCALVKKFHFRRKNNKNQQISITDFPT